ncbi:MAG: dienelactone hydrolase family protein [Actinomycetota bacterium]|nr:dienelactone hydrolase family protein [Actinomycetota bacterium]MDA8315011.1 dienelactone hydrolase family protein [Actinomycetota bacterium]
MPGRGPRPENGAHRSLAGIFLAPGAGGSAESPAFVELASSLEASGVPVQRMDFPYRLAGRQRPDPPAVLEASVRERACSFARHLGTETSTLVLGGRSMGGRICSQVVAEGLPAAGLALVSYPLHPPGRPERLRVAHFPQLRVPCLFVSGTKDAFATRDELETATAAIPGPVSHVWLEGADHGLRKHGAAAAAAILQWLASTFRLPTGGGTSEP